MLSTVEIIDFKLKIECKDEDQEELYPCSVLGT